MGLRHLNLTLCGGWNSTGGVKLLLAKSIKQSLAVWLMVLFVVGFAGQSALAFGSMPCGHEDCASHQAEDSKDMEVHMESPAIPSLPAPLAPATEGADCLCHQGLHYVPAVAKQVPEVSIMPSPPAHTAPSSRLPASPVFGVEQPPRIA